jgi:hypothetical protein
LQQVFDFPTAAAIAEYVATKLPAATAAVIEISEEEEEAGAWEAAVHAGGFTPAYAAPGAAAPAVVLAVTAFTSRVSRHIWSEGFTYDAVSAVPLERWDPEGAWASSLLDAPATGGAASKPFSLRFGVFLPPDMAAAFEAAALGMSAAEAVLMDPQQRLLMEVFAEALGSRDSSSSSGGASTAVGPTGVYVGISSMDYQKLAARYVAGVTVYSATGAATHDLCPTSAAYHFMFLLCACTSTRLATYLGMLLCMPM